MSKIPEGLAYHLALNKPSTLGHQLWTEEEICADHGITVDELDEFKQLPEFQKELLVAIKDNKENGKSVQLKARAMFEHYMESWVQRLMTDDEAPAAEKNKAFMFLGKVSGLVDDKQAATDKTQQVAMPSINIFLANQDQRIEKVINP